MSEGLCWKCKEDFMSRCHDYGLDGYFADHFLHCHHEEEEKQRRVLDAIKQYMENKDKPKEKPKCWCEVNRSGCYTALNNTTIRVIFCPQCGKKLGD